MRKTKLLLLLLVSQFVFGQQHKVDSLLDELSHTAIDTERMDIYLSLASHILKKDSSISYATKCLTIAKTVSDKKRELSALYIIADNYQKNYLHEKALEYASKVKPLAEELSNDRMLSLYYLLVAKVQERKSFYKEAIINLTQSLKLMRGVKDSIQLTNIISNLAFNYSMVFEDSLSLLYYTEGIEIARNIQNDGAQALLLNNLGSLYYYMGKYKRSITLFEQSTSITKDAVNMIHILNSSYGYLGDVYFDIGTYDKAISYTTLSIALGERRNDLSFLKTDYNKLGDIYHELKDYTKSLNYYFKALSTNSDFINAKDSSEIYSDIGHSYLLQNKLDSCKYYIDKSISISKREKYIGNEIIAKEILGQYYFQKKEYQKAINQYEQCQTLLAKINQPFDEPFVRLDLSECHYKLGQYDKAIGWLLKTLALEEIDITTEYRIIVYAALSKNYEAIGNNQKALSYLKQNNILKDSVANSNMLKNSYELKEKFESQQKENEILKLSNKNKAIDIELEQSKLMNISGFLLLLVLIGWALFFWNKKKQKQKIELLNSKLKAGEQEKTRIGKVLHDEIAGGLIRLIQDTEKQSPLISKKIKTSYNQIRTISHQLDNSPNHNEYLYLRLMDLTPDDDSIIVSISPNNLILKEPSGTHVYRIIQELIVNKIKHSQAEITMININLADEVLSLDYKDNGVGEENIKLGNGLKNINDRVVILGGSIDIESKKDQGFHVSIKVPCIN